MGKISAGVFIGMLCVAFIAGTASTQVLAPKAALERLFTADRINAEWFAQAFLAAVPVSRVEEVIAELKRTHGAYQRVDEEEGQYLVVFERAFMQARIALDAEERIATLLFLGVRARVSGFDQAVQDLRALPGRVSLLVMEDGRERGALNPDAAGCRLGLQTRGPGGPEGADRVRAAVLARCRRTPARVEEPAQWDPPGLARWLPPVDPHPRQPDDLPKRQYRH